MKTQFKCSINNVLLSLLAAATLFLLGFGCAMSKPAPDPLAGFHVSDVANLYKNKDITKDYKAYIQTLSPEEKQNLGPYPASFYEDDTGQHAVEIRIGINGLNWHHVLIYDKDNKRIKTVKYSSGHYAS